MKACSHCNKNDHASSKCPSLHDVLNDGFYTGGNGGGGHDHDEEDAIKSYVRIPCVSSYRRPYVCAGQGKNEHSVQFPLAYLYPVYLL